MNPTLRPHQEEKSKEILEILNNHKICYLKGEVRSGKTITALEACKLYGVKHLLFLTRKNAISSIESDHSKMGYKYDITVINYESVHKVEGDFDFVIYDEAHVLSAFPRPAKRVREIKKRFKSLPCILMSGTPSAESQSQYYHQFFVSNYSPFKEYTSFYKWAKEFVNVKQKRIGTHIINDYSDAIESKIEPIIAPISVIMTQEDAGFEVNITETIIEIEPPTLITNLANKLLEDRAIEGKNGYVMGETPAKLQSKVHQIYNGTVIIEKDDGSTEGVILSDYKAKAIKERFKGQKIAVMYYYQMELEMLKNVFGSDITTDLDEFNTTDKNFAIQQLSTEGMNISKADCLVYLNFSFSGKSYIQSRDRLTIKDRKDNNVYFIIEKNGINGKILNIVKDKKSYNSRSFMKDFVKK